MSYEAFGLLCLLMPLMYEMVAWLSGKFTFIPRMPTYSRMGWKRIDRWSVGKKWAVVIIATTIYVVTLGHFMWSWLRSWDQG